jgi:hypothetical protein
MVSMGPQGHHHHPTGDFCPLASGRLPSVLALEIPLPWRPTEGRRGPVRVDLADERGKSVVGSAAHPWRAAQARFRGRSVERREVHGQAMRPAAQGERTFLRNHASDVIAAMDLFVVPTIGFDLLDVGGEVRRGRAVT